MKFFQKNLHEHEDGTLHTHNHNGLHTHDQRCRGRRRGQMAKDGIIELPDFESMTKSKITEWAEDYDISVDSNKTKAIMIEEIKGQL